MEIFQNISGRLNGFWGFLSLTWLIFIILWFVFIYPLSKEYASIGEKLKDLSASFERYSLGKKIYNNKWITSKEHEVKLYEKEIENCRSFFKERDEVLEAIFTIEDPEKGTVKVEDEAIWKNEYLRRTNLLFAALEKYNIGINKESLPFCDWGPEIPSWENIIPVQKKFWILESLINAVINSGGVIKINSIKFRESDHILNHNRPIPPVYTPIPLSMKVLLQADRIQFLLHSIFKSDILFVIEGMSITGTGRTFQRKLPEDRGAVNNSDFCVIVPVVDVAIDMHVIDFET